MYQTYIFDLYGTLVDIHTDETKIEVWEKMALFYGYYGAFYTAEELRQTYRELTQEAEKEALRHDSHESFPELQIEDVFLELFRRKGADVLKETAVYAGQFFRVLTTEYIRLYDGTRELLEALKASGGSIYLLSNAQRIFTAYEMKALDIFRYFDGIYISSSYGVKKPDRRFFEILLEKEELKREEAVMIGNDGICDIRGAKEAGIDTFYIRSNISPKEETPDADFVLEEMDQRRVKEMLLSGKKKEALWLRPYREEDAETLAQLFYDTVHTVNAADYTKEQLDVWAPKERDLHAWNQSFLKHRTLVAERDGRIAGFGDMDETGYLDRLYAHREFQRQGIAEAICDALEGESEADVFETHASITARTFFEARGYEVIRAQQVERQGILLTNYVMRKRRQ